MNALGGDSNEILYIILHYHFITCSLLYHCLYNNNIQSGRGISFNVKEAGEHTHGLHVHVYDSRSIPEHFMQVIKSRLLYFFQNIISVNTVLKARFNA